MNPGENPTFGQVTFIFHFGSFVVTWAETVVEGLVHTIVRSGPNTLILFFFIKRHTCCVVITDGRWVAVFPSTRLLITTGSSKTILSLLAELFTKEEEAQDGM